ncbi:NTP transferase domain-containing protein [Candidatus Woesearchaeota archaeon]|nr:NTP transferase domain-containing protein [Candidatus Woesearchaeota archaeon]
MQAVILAAGKSTRTYPLTLTRPKPLLKAANKTILEYNLEALKNIADELIVVVGYKKDMIKKFIEENYNELNIKFIEQKEQLGTGHAVSILKDKIKGRFIVLMGDNIYSKEDIKNIAKHQYSILVNKVKNPELFGVVKEKNGILADIVEKPKEFVSDLASCALYSFDVGIFNELEKVKKSERNEYEITDAIKGISLKEKIYCIKSKSCFQISFPWDLLKVDNIIRKGKSAIGKNSEIKGMVENSSIGDNCIINGNVKNSIIMNNTIIEKNSIVEDSIIGENVRFSGKIISKNDTYSIIKNKKIKIDKAGAIIGDNVNADGTVIEPGCKIWPNKKISGEIKNDIQ